MGPLLDAVLLDARATVAAASRKILAGGLEYVAVRRSAGLFVFWYVRSAQEVVDRIAACPPDMPLAIALDLHEHQASPVQDRAIEPAAPPPAADAVVIDGGEFLGIRRAGALPDAGLPDGPLAPATPAIRSAPQPPAAAPPASDGRPDRVRPPRKPSSRKIRTFGVPAPAGDELFGVLQGAADPLAPPQVMPAAPFTAYPQMDMPAQLAGGEAFNLVIGLGAGAQAGTLGGPFTIVPLPSQIEHFDLDLMVVADGFELPQGYRYRLRVERQHPEAHSVSVAMVAPAASADPLLTTVSVIYFHRNIPCGTAARRVAVLAAGGVAAGPSLGNGSLWTAPDASAGGSLNLSADTPPIDLVVTISKPDGNSASGQFLWSFASPHAVDLPPKPLPCDLGTDARDLGTKVIEGIQNSESQGMVDLEIAGLASSIRDKIPGALWPLLAQLSQILGPQRTPSVLFLTAESHVPWELALVDPPLDATAPPYLGCQVDMGRWPLNASGSPALPPAASIDVKQFAVVVGDYAARSGWRKLNEAELEGSAITQRYGAIRLKAAPPEMRQLLTASLPLAQAPGGAEAVHFACHGEALQGHVLDAAIILDAGQRMSPMWLAAAPLGKQNRPFLFLNACQVGRAGELLGGFSGFAGESLKGGFRGFLAPLWSVDDGIAHAIAIEFYERAFGAGGKPPQPVAAILRDLRRRFAPATEKNSSTRLAYVFYGHPGLTLHRLQEN